MFSIISKAKWLVGGNILFAFAQWLTITIIANKLPAASLGEYSYALSVAAPIFILTNLQLRSILVADYNSTQEYEYKTFFALRIYASTCALLIILIWAYLSKLSSFSIILLVSVIKLLESFSDIIYALYNARNKTRLITRSLSLKSVTSLALVLLVIMKYESLSLSLIAIVFAYLAILIVVDLRSISIKLNWLKLDFKEAKKLIVYALPLGATVMLVSLQVNMPKYFLERYDSIESVGVFTILFYFIVIGSIFISSISQYLSPFYSKFWTDKVFKSFYEYITYAWAVALLFGVSSWLVIQFYGDQILLLIYGEIFSNYIDILKIVMLAGIFSYLSVVNGYIMTAVKIIKPQVPMFVFLTALTVVCSWLLIPQYKLMGAAWVSVITFSTQFLIGLVILIKKFKGTYE